MDDTGKQVRNRGWRHSSRAKEKRNGNDCFTNMICWRRALICILKRTEPNMLCEFKRSTEKSGTRDPCRKDENSQQPKLGHLKRNGDWWRKSRNINERRKYKILGPDENFPAAGETEIRNRIRAAWATFHTYRQVLTSRNYMLRHRLRLFDAVITPTMNYASGTWTLTKEHERMMQSTQRKILRLIIRSKRRYKIIVKRKDETNEKKDTDDLGSTGDESEDMDKAQTHTTIRTSVSKKIPTQKSTQQWLKKKIGLTT